MQKPSNNDPGSAKTVAEFFEYSINTILFQRGVYPAEDFTPVKKYGLNMLVSSDDQVKSYIKKIMSQLNKWMLKSKISKFVVVITSKETGEHVERWQFDVQVFGKGPKSKSSSKTADSENANPRFVAVRGGQLPWLTFDIAVHPPLSQSPKRQKRKYKRKSKPSSGRSQHR